MAKRTGERASNSAAARARNCDVERAEIESQSCGSERRSLHGGGLRRSRRRCSRATPELGVRRRKQLSKSDTVEPLRALSTGQPSQLMTCISQAELGAPNPSSS